VRLVVDDNRVLPSATADLHALLESVDAAASRFRADSALSYANAHAGRPVPVPHLLVDLVAAALQVAAHTNGAVDPTVGRVLAVLGYDRDISAVAGDGPAVTATATARTWRDIRLDRAVGLLNVPRGTQLDLGASAKAYTADLAARTLAQRYDTAVFVELGGDIAVAGTRAAGWGVRVAERADADGPLVLLHHGGLTTSTTTVRQWRRGGHRVHHIVDPRTGLPADGPWRTATVAAPDALHANAASTAAIVMGERASDWLVAHGYAARLVGQDGAVHCTPGWPAEELVAA
jgi:thiamine biosynthesis lipoprotein